MYQNNIIIDCIMKNFNFNINLCTSLAKTQISSSFSWNFKFSLFMSSMMLVKYVNHTALFSLMIHYIESISFVPRKSWLVMNSTINYSTLLKGFKSSIFSSPLLSFSKRKEKRIKGAICSDWQKPPYVHTILFLFLNKLFKLIK